MDRDVADSIQLFTQYLLELSVRLLKQRSSVGRQRQRQCNVVAIHLDVTNLLHLDNVATHFRVLDLGEDVSYGRGVKRGHGSSGRIDGG